MNTWEGVANVGEKQQEGGASSRRVLNSEHAKA